MTVSYGADYSSGELSVSQLNSFSDYDIRLLIRYIGWPENPKCISHYPGAHEAHVKGGRTVLLAAEQAPAPVSASQGATPGKAPPWPLPAGNCFGLITGPAASHGGYHAADRPFIQQIQQALIRQGFVPGVTALGSSWANGTYTEPTREAVLRFQHATGRPQTGTIGPDDWARLLA